MIKWFLINRSSGRSQKRASLALSENRYQLHQRHFALVIDLWVVLFHLSERNSEQNEHIAEKTTSSHHNGRMIDCDMNWKLKTWVVRRSRAISWSFPRFQLNSGARHGAIKKPGVKFFSAQFYYSQIAHFHLNVTLTELYVKFSHKPNIEKREEFRPKIVKSRNATENPLSLIFDGRRGRKL